jgi:hypothetical protein
VYDAVLARFAGHRHYEHFAGAWNALAYRYQAVIDAGEAFSDLIAAHGTTPAPDVRYQQERALFDFYSAGFSVFECTCYALYAIGAFIRPDLFLLGTERDQQRVSPPSTRDAFGRAFPGDPICAAFATLFADPEYQQWREVRNVLTHRTAPGRRIYVSIGMDDELPTEWKLNNTPLDASIATRGRAELGRLLTGLLNSAARFAGEQCGRQQARP